MSKDDLPNEPAPLTPIGYWQESLQTWADFSRRTSQIMMSQAGRPRASSQQGLDPETETLASEILRTYSDMNLRHWQNTARLLESLPAWMRLPNSMAGSALVDWFDTFQQKSGRSAEQAPTFAPSQPAIAAPNRLTAPKGKADDLTRIKGIGPKLSARLNELGIYHFKQIAGWTNEEAQWVDEFLSFKGRVEREAWIPQARVLSANGSAATLH